MLVGKVLKVIFEAKTNSCNQGKRTNRKANVAAAQNS